MSDGADSGAALSPFDPVVADWFRQRVGEPTDVQAAAWPEIAAGAHVLVTAPTGSGKTLTAFLWALDRLLTGAWAGGATRVLYVSPLKALNNDIRRNLLRPLAEIEAAFDAAGRTSEPVRVMTRSGDTPQRERQRMARRPPEILITTPESLAILLTSRGGRGMLDGLATVILDEIHAVAGSKRGTQLMTSVERLVPLSGEIQRLALSATVRPAERVAAFVGGRERTGADGYRPRPVRVVGSRAGKRYDLEVRHALPTPGPPPAATEAVPPAEAEPSVWDALTAEIKSRIRGNRSTLIFANSRRTTEKLTRLLNVDEPSELVYSHHGSLSREIRQVVEKRLKEGSLAGIVATSSLELGIDIGALDEVVLVQTPPTVASAVQRIGRAGHRVGGISRARLLPLFERDLLDAAVVAAAIEEGAVEEVEPPEAPLDVLAQTILSMVATEPWEADELFSLLRSAAPYARLSRRSFDLVLEMLAGRYADSRVRELQPRVAIDRLTGVVQGRPGAARLVYLSGGTIPDRGYYHLRLADSMARLGELDEEFVWERSLGDTFTLGAQSWRIRRITHNDVLVAPAARAGAMAPFWKAEARNRSFHLSERAGRFLARAEASLARGGGRDEVAERLRREHAMTAEAADALVAFLERQRAETDAPLPHRSHLLAEWTAEAGEEGGGRRVVLHTIWGGRVNRPFAMALAAASEERLGVALSVEHDDDCVTFALPDGVDLAEALQWVRSDNVEGLLRRRLETTGFFGARFRESAGRALLLPRGDFRRRVPLWLNRQRAKKLLETVARYEDFPVLVETWRTCLQDEFDLTSLATLLDELAQEEIRVTEVRTAAPSPFASGLVWKETNRLMYEDDAPEGGASSLSAGLLRELVFSSQLRPLLPESLLDGFQRKLQRTWPGYAPRGAEELTAWVEERLALSLEEWRELLEARARDAAGEDDTALVLRSVAARLVIVRTPGGEGFVAAAQRVPRILRALGAALESVELEPLAGEIPAELTAAIERWAEEDGAATEDGDEATDLVGEWMRYYGPFREETIQRVFGLEAERARRVVESLVEEERAVVDRFRRGDPERVEVCDAENLERLLRALRAAARPEFRARPLDELPLFLALHQGVARPADGVEGLQAALEGTFAFPAAARLWESEILPARLDPYYPVWLDTLLAESELVWVGCGEERSTFVFASDLDLLDDGERARAAEADAPEADDAELLTWLESGSAATLEELARASGRGSGELTRALWRAAWAGRVTTTDFRAVRAGALAGFSPVDAPGARPGSGRRGRFDRWKVGRPLAAAWRPLPGAGDGDRDVLEAEELGKERARVLMARYGVVFRELLARELPAFAWSGVFRALRLMELSGEVVPGHFFDGPPGPQFASHSAFKRLRRGLERDVFFWLNAIDPAAPCGLGLEPWKGRFPARLPSNHLVFHGTRLVCTSRRHGADLAIDADVEAARAPEVLRFLEVALTRRFDPRKLVDVETINGVPAAGSPWARALAERFDLTREPGGLRLRRRY